MYRILALHKDTRFLFYFTFLFLKPRPFWAYLAAADQKRVHSLDSGLLCTVLHKHGEEGWKPKKLRKIDFYNHCCFVDCNYTFCQWSGKPLVAGDTQMLHHSQCSRRLHKWWMLLSVYIFSDRSKSPRSPHMTGNGGTSTCHFRRLLIWGANWLTKYN